MRQKTTMSSFTYFLTQNYLNSNQDISQCTTPSRVFDLFTLPHNFLRSDCQIGPYNTLCHYQKT